VYPVDLHSHRLIVDERVGALRRAAAGAAPFGSGRVRRRLGRWLVSAGVRLEFGSAPVGGHPSEGQP
jgi:hypothetical protein